MAPLKYRHAFVIDAAPEVVSSAHRWRAVAQVDAISMSVKLLDQVADANGLREIRYVFLIFHDLFRHGAEQYR